MTSTVLNGSEIVVGVCMENNAGALTEGGTALDQGSIIGKLWDSGLTPTLYEIPVVLECSLEDIGIEYEEINTLNSDHMLPRAIKDKGSVTLKILAFDDDDTTTVTTADTFNWLHAATEYPFGVTNSSGGAAEYKILDDDPTGNRDDNMGWAVEVLVDSKIKYVFHNCILSVTPTLGHNDAKTLEIKFTNARMVEILNTTTLQDHDKTT